MKVNVRICGRHHAQFLREVVTATLTAFWVLGHKLVAENLVGHAEDQSNKNHQILWQI